MWENWGTARTVKPSTVILPSRPDDVVPIADRDELVRDSGATLIEAGLKSLVIRNRSMAVNALAAWSREDWPSGLKEALERAVGCEPKEDARERTQKTLRGESLAE